MSYIRRLMVGSALLIYSVCGFSVGLGDLESKSSLNEPFDARVDIINLGDLDPDLVKVRLASAEDFERVGTSRELFLLDLRFNVDVSNPQKPVVQITSSKPVREPYLDFLVELKWPAGRILRGYTVFLDLPVFAGKISPQIAPTTQAPASKSSAPVSGTSKSSSAEAVADGSERARSYRVRSGDTLWTIAQRSRPRGSSVQQAMTAIYDQNRSAFINDDMNRLRKGALLALPDVHAITSVDEQYARTQVARSAEDLQARADLPELVTSGENDINDIPAKTISPDGDGVLRLLAPDTVSATEANAEGASDSPEGEGEGGGDREALENELAIAEEKLLQAEHENQVLAEQLAEQQEEIARMSRLLELEGSELAAIQQGIEPEGMGQDDQESMASEQAEKQTGLFDDIRDKLTLIAGGLLILILGVLFLLSRGRKNQDSETLMAEVEADLDRNKEQAPSSIVAAAAPIAEEAFGQESDAQATVEVAQPEVGLGEVDPIGEADIYLSFGDYAQAEAVVQRGLENNADDSRVHLKLLDILAAQGDIDRFEEHYPKLLALGDLEAIQGADRMRGSLVGAEESILEEADTGLDLGVGEESFQESDVEELLAETPEEATGGALEPVDEELDLALDIATEELEADSAAVLEEDLDLALEIDEAGLAADAPALEAEDFQKEEIIDLGDLDLDLEGESADAEKSESLDFDDFDDDLDSLVGGDEVATQLELAQAYVDMGDQAGAKDILDDVIANGSEAQQSEAQAILAKIS